MKINRTYTLDLQNVEKLQKVDNASSLINSLLTEHFLRSDKLAYINNLSEDEIALEKKKIDIKEKAKLDIEALYD